MQHLIPFLMVFSLGVTFSLMIFIVINQYKSGLGFAYFIVCLSFLFWDFGGFFRTVLADEAHRIWWFQISSFGWATFPVTLLFLVQEMTKCKVKKSRRLSLYLSGIMSITIILFVYKNPMAFIAKFEKTAFGWGVIRSVDSIELMASLAFIFGLTIISFVQLFFWRQKAELNIEKRQVLILLTTGCFALVSSGITDLLVPFFGVPMVSLLPVLTMPWFIGLFVIAHQLRALEHNPTIVVGELMSRVRDMVFLLNRHGDIIQMNMSARDVLNYTFEDEKLLHIHALLPQIQLPALGKILEMDSFMVTSGGGKIPVQISINTRVNAYHDLIGYIVTSYDMRLRMEMELQSIEVRLAETGIEDQVRVHQATIDHIKTGVLHFGQDLRIHSKYSAYCLKLLQQTDIANCDFIDTVLGSLVDSEKNQLRELISGIFNEDKTWKLDAMVSLLPKNVNISNQLIYLTYHVITIDPQQSHKMILVLLDRETAESTDAENSSDETSRLSMVVSVLTNKEAFFEFYEEYQQWFSIFKMEWEASQTKPQENLYHLFRSVHTFKSGFARFGMNVTAANLMDYEYKLSSLLTTTISVDDLNEAVKECEPVNWVSLELHLLKNMMGSFFSHSQDIVEINREQLEESMNALQNDIRNSSLPVALIKKNAIRFRELYSLHAKVLLQEYETYINKICNEKNMITPEFSVFGTDVLLDTKKFRPFFRTMIHIFNNIVAHAIERPEERLILGKPERGRIECHIQSRNGQLVLDIADDGRGIDPNEIRKDWHLKYDTHERSSVQVYSEYEDDKILQTIFEPGYSSVKVVDSLSGRGIGLFAVAYAAKNLGGSVRVYSGVGVFTRFHIVIPIEARGSTL